MGGSGPWIERWMIWLGCNFFRLFFRVFSPLRVAGLENVPAGGGVLFLPNHIAALDVFAVPVAIYSKFPQEVLRQAAKEELLRMPVLGWILAKWRALPVRRNRADLSSIRALESCIRRDKVILYPEGTRSPDGKLQPGNRMVGLLIRNTRPVVIPVAVRGTDEVFLPGKTLPRRGGNVDVVFGAPLDLSEEYAIENSKESSTRIIEKVMGAISDLQAEVPGAASRNHAAMEMNG